MVVMSSVPSVTAVIPSIVSTSVISTRSPVASQVTSSTTDQLTEHFMAQPKLREPDATETLSVSVCLSVCLTVNSRNRWFSGFFAISGGAHI